MTEPVSELLMFQVGARVFAATVPRRGPHRQRRRRRPAEQLVEGTSLGATFARERGIVVAATGRAAPSRPWWWTRCWASAPSPTSEIQPLPAFAAAVLRSGAVSGFVLLDDAPTLIVDLPTLIRERRAAAAA